MRRLSVVSVLVLSVLAFACGKDKDGDSNSLFNVDSLTGSTSTSQAVTAPSPTQAVVAPSPSASPEASPAPADVSPLKFHIENDPFIQGGVGVCLPAGDRSFRVVIDDAGPVPLTATYNMYQCGERLIGAGNQCQMNPQNYCDGRSPDFTQERLGMSIEGPTTFAPHTKGSFIVNIDGDAYDCGHSQGDLALNGTVVWAGLMDYGHRCNMCAYLDPKITPPPREQTDHTATFTATFKGVNGAVIDFGDGAQRGIFNGQSLTHAFPASVHTTYTVRLIVTKDGVPCEATTSVTIKPLPAVCSPHTQTVNVGEDATFTVTGEAPFAWSAGGTPASGSGASFTTKFSTPGFRYVTVLSAFSGSDTCGVTALSVLPLCLVGPGGPANGYWLKAICDDYWELHSESFMARRFRVTVGWNPNAGIVLSSVDVPANRSFRFISAEPHLNLWIRVGTAWFPAGRIDASSAQCPCQLP